MSSLFKTLNTDPDSKPDDSKHPKQRLLVLSSRGVTYRHRHLLNDLCALLPHSRKDAKLDTKSQLHLLNEVAELYNCNGVMFFEARKRQDLYMWLSRVPNGPCIKFHVQNLHTMNELNFSGNALKGSRAILSFDAAFNKAPATLLIKELLTQTFAVPKHTRKSKPFIDRVLSFTYSDDRVWVRHYQIVVSRGEDLEDEERKGEEKTELVEIGPRFVMSPIIILEGSFGGPVVYENKEFVSPNTVRREIREKRVGRKTGREDMKVKRTVKRREVEAERDVVMQNEIDDAVLFA